MRTLPLLIVICALSVIISGCQKEISADNLLPATGNLVKTSSGDCSPVVLGGTFVQSTQLGAGNYMDVQVNFTGAGDYAISTDTINGYYFSSAGQATTGTNTIRLAASGTPLVAGANIFTILFGTDSCQASVLVSSSVAVYTFGNTAGVCAGATVAGTYNTGVALTSSNTITIQVDVTTTGAYTINSDTVNGVSFSSSGTFTTTGAQTVTLSGSGTPATAGPFTFNSSASGGCTFVVTINNPTGSLALLTTTAATAITCTSAITGGNITSDGGTAITARGICYGTTVNPTTAQTVVNSGTGTGTFTSNISGLTPGTVYHARAFAVNSAGTAYGNDVTFTAATGCAVTVYVAGRDDAYNLTGNIPNPKIWVRPVGTFTGTPLPFTSGVYDAEANSVFVTASDVYVAGKQNSTASLWKNGVLNELTAAPAPPNYVTSGAYGVFVSGTDVYVAGFSDAGSATLWKNGVATVLGGPQSEAFSVFVSGSDVYVAGYEGESINSNFVYRAKVWKNGIATTLSGTTEDARALSVFVSGSDVYVAGKEGNQAKLWKNGVATTLSVSGSNAAVANSVFVSGTDVYVAGTEDNGNSPSSFAKIWKNGTGSLLTGADTHNRATSIYVFGGRVYVAGSIASSTGNTRAAVWVDGSMTNLTNGSTDAYGNGIFVR